MARHSVAIYLAANPMDCRVLLDGRDISDACRGVDVSAMVQDGFTVVRLHLLADVEIVGEAGSIEIRKGAVVPRETDTG